MRITSNVSKLRLFSLFGGLAVVCGGMLVPARTSAEDKKVDFASDVQPILQKSCVGCHGGTDAKTGKPKIKGKFNITTKETFLKGGDNGAKDVVPGKAEDSLVYKLLLGPVGKGDDEIGRMPAGKKADPLPADQIAIIKSWIDQGANWPDGVKLSTDAK